MNYQKRLDEILEEISKEETTPKLLLHACCAPCSSYVIEYLSKYFDITIYYYNPNIEPYEEFDKRAKEVQKFVSNFKTTNPVKCVVEHYDNEEFENMIKGLEEEPEGSNRCFKCYELRMRAAANYAKKNNFDYFTTTLSISPYKNSKKLNEIGELLEKEIEIKYLYGDFKKKNGYKRSIELAKEYDLYRQDYCGCKYSKIARDKRELDKQEKSLKDDIVVPEKPEIKNNVANLYNNYYNKNVTKKKKKNSDLNMFEFHDIKKRDLKKSSFIKIVGGITKLIILLAVLLTGVYFIVKALPNKKSESITPESSKANINEIYIYGTHLNLKGTLKCDKTTISDVNLVMIGNNNKKVYDLFYNINTDKTIDFNVADTLNTGFVLDTLIIDNYVLFIDVVSDGKSYYYPIENESDYKTTTYYGLTNDNVSKKFVITDESTYDSMAINISKSTDEVYDVIIDPGHGGSDVGACYNSKCETDYTLMLSELLKKDLEKAGFKVALTRTENKWVNKYGETGRVTKAYESNAKLLISIHLNSSDVTMNGFELYTASNIDLTFARNTISSLDKVSDFTYSYNTFAKEENGIYTRTFDTTDLNNLNKEAVEKKFEPYNVSLNTNYYFIIRETGGYMTGAYIDGRDGNDENSYVLSNRGLESYILELGYITSKTDLDYIDKYKSDYMQKFSDTITSYLNN